MDSARFTRDADDESAEGVALPREVGQPEAVAGQPTGGLED
jgi:hypothetical protein